MFVEEDIDQTDLHRFEPSSRSQISVEQTGYGSDMRGQIR